VQQARPDHGRGLAAINLVDHGACLRDEGNVVGMVGSGTIRDDKQRRGRAATVASKTG
jgi:hypothetical protein